MPPKKADKVRRRPRARVRGPAPGVRSDRRGPLAAVGATLLLLAIGVGWLGDVGEVRDRGLTPPGGRGTAMSGGRDYSALPPARAAHPRSIGREAVPAPADPSKNAEAMAVAAAMRAAGRRAVAGWAGAPSPAVLSPWTAPSAPGAHHAPAPAAPGSGAPHAPPTTTTTRPKSTTTTTRRGTTTTTASTTTTTTGTSTTSSTTSTTEPVTPVSSTTPEPDPVQDPAAG